MSEATDRLDRVAKDYDVFVASDGAEFKRRARILQRLSCTKKASFPGGAGVTRNVAASVHQRLLNRARTEARPFNELLQYFAMERFLYRLGRSPYRDQFVLKGCDEAFTGVLAKRSPLGLLKKAPAVVVVWGGVSVKTPSD